MDFFEVLTKVQCLSALTLLVGTKMKNTQHLPVKKLIDRCWCSYLCRTNTVATQSSQASLKHRMVYLLLPTYLGCPGKETDI